MKRSLLFVSALAASLAAAGPARAEGDAPRIEWRDCPWTQAQPGDARCGDLVVPQSRGTPASATIKVFFAVYRRTESDAPAPDPIVIVPGGPGALFNPPVAYVMDGLAELRRRREIIIIDQRGVGHSTPRLVCVPEPRDDGAVPPRRLSALDCIAKLKERGVDPAAFSTEETARDLYDLRRALKLESWNPMGASYGSRVVLRLAQIDPAGTRAAVVMASLPLSPSLARAENALFRRSLLGRLFTDCAADALCEAAYGDLAAKFARIQELLREGASARTSPEGKEVYDQLLSVDRRTGGIASALIRRLDWADELPHLPRAIAELYDFVTGAKLLSRARVEAIYGVGAPSRLPPIDNTLIYVTTRCPEDVLPEYPMRGAWRRRDSCSAFEPAPVADTPPAETPPLLILTGAYDIRTLTGWSDEIARHFPGSIVARMGDAGHDVSYRHTCGNALMNAFVADPKAKLDTSCIERHQRPRFEVPDAVQ